FCDERFVRQAIALVILRRLRDDWLMGSLRPPARDRGTASLAGAPRATGPSRRGLRPPATSPLAIEPSVLLLGAGPELESALSAALSRHRVFVETADAEAVLDAVTVAAPDLVLVAGDAARDCGSAVLARLAASPSSSVVPVVVVDDHTTLDARLRAFRHGATAIIPRSASIDAIAEQVSRLAREVPNRAAATMGKLGEATLEEFIGALSTQLRTGILSVRGSGLPDDAEVRLVLGGGRPLAEAV